MYVFSQCDISVKKRNKGKKLKKRRTFKVMFFFFFCFFLLLEQSHPRILNIQTLMNAPIGVSTNQKVNAVFILIRLRVIRLVCPNV